MRFFIFFYTFQTKTKTGNGSVWLERMESFPSNDFIKECAADGSIFNSSNVVVTGWKEMQEDDFYNFTGTKPKSV